MARKSAALLKSTPVKLSKLSKVFLAELAKFKPVEGCEDQWANYMARATEHEEQTSRYDAVFMQVEKEGGSSTCKSWPAFLLAGKSTDQTAKAAFGALDVYQYAVKHRFDKVGVPETDLRAVIGDTFSENLSVKINLKNSGLLAAKVAQAIRTRTAEESVGDPPFCSDCQG